MPQNVIRDVVLFGYRVDQQGAMSLNGCNFRCQSVTSKPAVERRPKPLDTSEYSLSNTPRTYLSEYTTWSDMVMKHTPAGKEYVPGAFVGGVGSYGLTQLAPYDLQTKLLLKIKGQTANLGITLAQYRDLTTVWSSFATQVLEVAAKLQRIRNPRNLSRMMRKRKIAPGVGSILSSASGAYLGYLFGVDQFVSDFSACRDALRRRFEDPIYITLNATTYRQRDHKLIKGNSGYGDWVAERTELRSDRVKARYRVFPNDQVLAQMGLTNPLAALWDFVPFSFVVNTLIPVGQYLAALDALVGVSDLRWYYTTEQVEEVYVTYPTWGGGHAGFRQRVLMRGGVSNAARAALPRFAFSKQANFVLTGVALLSVLRDDPKVSRAILRLHP